MRKLTNMLYAVALATLSTGFVACSSDADEMAETNPNYNPNTHEVVTSFVFNVATNNTPMYRMTEANTQATSSASFRGISNAKLFTFERPADGKHLYNVTDASVAATKFFDLASVLSPGEINHTDKSHRVLEIGLPVATNTLLFYGKATQGTPSFSAPLTIEDAIGSTTMNIADQPYNTTFVMNQRCTGDNATRYNEMVEMLTNVINRIGTTTLLSTTDVYFPTAPTTVSHPTDISWGSYLTTPGKSPLNSLLDQTALEEILASILRELITVPSGEMRDGSGTGVLHQIAELWTLINKVVHATPTNDQDAIAIAFAKQVQNRLDKYFNGTVPVDGSPVTNVDFKDVQEIGEQLETVVPGYAAANYANIKTLDLIDFPENVALPKGATQLNYNTTSKLFEYNTSLSASGMGGGSITKANYVYPSELMYFGNSPIRTSDVSKVPADYPDGVSNWDTPSQWSADWVANSHVYSSTRSVAMQYDINYGNALLKTTVRFGAANLEDNNAAIQLARHSKVEANRVIPATAGKFLLTSILVGGQPNKVGWDFIPTSDATFTQYVYDRQLNTGAETIPTYVSGTEYSTPNYTLLFDNYDAAHDVDEQNIVYVALEFQNKTGNTFWAKDNLVPVDGYFYIIGKLDPAGKSYPTRTQTNYVMPPYKADGSGSVEAIRVFMQDFTTTANFVLGPTSLQKAYLTVPDLRSSQVSLGLSVDLNWETGLTFDSTLGN
jgi:hypothetical protein